MQVVLMNCCFYFKFRGVEDEYDNQGRGESDTRTLDTSLIGDAKYDDLSKGLNDTSVAIIMKMVLYGSKIGILMVPKA